MKLTGTNYSIVLILMMLMSGEGFAEQEQEPHSNQNVSSILGSIALTGWLLQGDRTRSHPEHGR